MSEVSGDEQPRAVDQIRVWDCSLSFSFFFFFFFSCYKTEIFSSFLKNKLVNKFILFCFYFTQSFIFNPIPF